VSDCHAASTLRREREPRRACSCRVPAQWRAKPVRLSHLVALSRAPCRSERPRECCCSMLQRCWFAFPCCATVLKFKHLHRADRRTTSGPGAARSLGHGPGQRPRRLGGLSRAGTRRLPRQPRRRRRGAGPGCPPFLPFPLPLTLRYLSLAVVPRLEGVGLRRPRAAPSRLRRPRTAGGGTAPCRPGRWSGRRAIGRRTGGGTGAGTAGSAPPPRAPGSRGRWRTSAAPRPWRPPLCPPPAPARPPVSYPNERRARAEPDRAGRGAAPGRARPPPSLPFPVRVLLPNSRSPGRARPCSTAGAR